MKMVLAALAVSLAPALSFAVSANVGGGFSSPGLEVEVVYTSWCVKNVVATQDYNGNVVERDNCGVKFQVCKDTEFYRAGKMIHAATCEAQ